MKNKSDSLSNSFRVEVNRVKREFRKLMELLPDGPTDNAVFERIMSLLDNNGFIYSQMMDECLVSLDFPVNDNLLQLLLRVKKDRVVYSVMYPFRVRFDAILFVSTYLHLKNQHAAATINTDVGDGSLTVDHEYVFVSPSLFREKPFWTHMKSVIELAAEHYGVLENLAKGCMPREEKNYCIQILLSTLNAVCDEEKRADLDYGIRPFFMEQIESES